MSISTALLRTGADNVADAVATAQEDAQTIYLPDTLTEYRDQPSMDGPLPVTPLGAQPPLGSERILAQKVIDGAPTNCTPFEVATYYWAIGQGKYGDDLRPYASAWPVRWNPVILEFFQATYLSPSDDTTPWCAAFMNYCLLRGAIGRELPAGSAPRTNSPGARSFEGWSKQTTTPQAGDIVVFENVKLGGGRGHVAFFLADQGDQVLVLGGNQLDGEPARHSICRKLYTKNGTVLKLLGYRTDPQLH